MAIIKVVSAVLVAAAGAGGLVVAPGIAASQPADRLHVTASRDCGAGDRLDYLGPLTLTNGDGDMREAHFVATNRQDSAQGPAVGASRLKVTAQVLRARGTDNGSAQHQVAFPAGHRVYGEPYASLPLRLRDVHGARVTGYRLTAIATFHGRATPCTWQVTVPVAG